MRNAVPGDPAIDVKARALVASIKAACAPGFLRNLDHKTLRELARAAGRLEVECRYLEPVRQNQATTLPGGAKVRRS